MSKTATFFVTLLGAFAVAAVFQLKHLMRVPETLYAEVAEVIGRGLGLFAIGWGIAGITTASISGAGTRAALPASSLLFCMSGCET